MEHSAYKEMLSALLDGELHGAEREAALAHIETCADCRAYFAELGALRAAFGDWEAFDAPEDFAAGVMARLRAEAPISRLRAEEVTMPPNAESTPKPAKKRATLRRYATLAACAAVILLAVYALPDAPRMGGASNGAAADSASSAVYAAPAEAPEAPAMPAPASQAPNPDYDYAYANSGETGGDAGNAAPETAPAKERGKTDVKMSAAGGDAVANSISNGTTGAALDSMEEGERYATTAVDEKLPIAGGDETPMEPLINTPEAANEELPVLTLSGERAESWLAENGWQGESGVWYADAAALRARPDGLTVSDSLPEDYDGPVLVELGEVRP